jgi:hypothetical protein
MNDILLIFLLIALPLFLIIIGSGWEYLKPTKRKKEDN